MVLFDHQRSAARPNAAKSQGAAPGRSERIWAHINIVCRDHRRESPNYAGFTHCGGTPLRMAGYWNLFDWLCVVTITE